MADKDELHWLLNPANVSQRGQLLPIGMTQAGNPTLAVPGFLMNAYQGAENFMTGANQGDPEQQIKDALMASSLASTGGIAMGSAPAGALGANVIRRTASPIAQQADDMLQRETARAANMSPAQKAATRQASDDMFSDLARQYPQRPQLTPEQRANLAKQPGSLLNEMTYGSVRQRPKLTQEQRDALAKEPGALLRALLGE